MFLRLTNEKLETRLHVRERVAQEHIMFLIDEIMASAGK